MRVSYECCIDATSFTGQRRVARNDADRNRIEHEDDKVLLTSILRQMSGPVRFIKIGT